MQPLTMREPTAPEYGRGGFLARTGPAELIFRIFQSCDSTRDLLALASTSQHNYRIWQAHAAPALWPVWLREIPYFRNALLAVSARSYARYLR